MEREKQTRKIKASFLFMGDRNCEICMPFCQLQLRVYSDLVEKSHDLSPPQGYGELIDWDCQLRIEMGNWVMRMRLLSTTQTDLSMTSGRTVFRRRSSNSLSEVRSLPIWYACTPSCPYAWSTRSSRGDTGISRRNFIAQTRRFVHRRGMRRNSVPHENPQAPGTGTLSI